MDKDLYNKLKEYSSEVHTKLVYSITGKRVGAIKDLHLCMRETDLILDYITNLEQQLKKKDEVIEKALNLIKLYGKYDGEKCTRGFSMMTADFNKLLQILEDKGV